VLASGQLSMGCNIDMYLDTLVQKYFSNSLALRPINLKAKRLLEYPFSIEMSGFLVELTYPPPRICGAAPSW